MGRITLPQQKNDVYEQEVLKMSLQGYSFSTPSSGQLEILSRYRKSQSVSEFLHRWSSISKLLVHILAKTAQNGNKTSLLPAIINYASDAQHLRASVCFFASFNQEPHRPWGFSSSKSTFLDLYKGCGTWALHLKTPLESFVTQ